MMSYGESIAWHAAIRRPESRRCNARKRFSKRYACRRGYNKPRDPLSDNERAAPAFKSLLVAGYTLIYVLSRFCGSKIVFNLT